MRLYLTAGLCILQNRLVNSLPQTNDLAQTVTGSRTYCDNEPCKNGGTCHMKEDNDVGKFYCQCANGWNGPTCEVPNPVLTCGTSQIKVSIDKRMISGNNLDSSPSLISFGESDDPACQASISGDNYELTISSPFNKNCGTEATRDVGPDGVKLDGNYIFHNTVVWKKVEEGLAGEAPIQRKIKLIDFKCQYEDEYLLHMVGIKPAESTIEQKTGKGTFEVDMTLWKNSDFERDVNGQYSSNPIIRIGQQVCVKMNLKSKLEMPNLVLTAANCWAAGSPNAAPEDRHNIIVKKCTSEEDYTTLVKKNGIDDEVKFCFQLYKWKKDMDQLYVQCEMSVCDDSIQFDGSSQCVCPPKSFQVNDWFYPNYYESMLDNMNNYDSYYGYGDFYTGSDIYGTASNDYMNNYGTQFYYDYQAPYDYSGTGGSRRRRSIEQGDVPLPTGNEKDALIQAELPSKRKRLDLKGRFEKDEDGNLKLPEGIRADSASDLINVGYGPINLKEKYDPTAEASTQNHGGNADIEISIIQESEWYETAEGASNVVLMAVGGSLILALIVLGIVIGVYIQFKNQVDGKNKKVIDDQTKVKQFMTGIMEQRDN